MRAATSITAGTREPVSQRTRFRMRLGRRNQGTNSGDGSEDSDDVYEGEEKDEDQECIVDVEEGEDEGDKNIDMKEAGKPRAWV